MRRISFRGVKETVWTNDVLPLVRQRVFHVTKSSNVPMILARGEIVPNDGSLETTFGFSTNSFFRNRGCVSVFDYRSASSKDFNDSVAKCWPMRPAEPGADVSFLVLEDPLPIELIPWTAWKEEAAWVEMIAPYVEAGHRGPIPIKAIDLVIDVAVFDEVESLATMLKKARVKKRLPDSSR